jgi:hypothetical protein
MLQTMSSRALLAGALSISLGALACGEANRATDALDPDQNRDMARTERAGHEGAPITVMGCLQKADGDYVVTRVNSPSEDPVATSGDAGRGDVAREHMRAAKHAYSLEGDDDRLEPLVGKQIRVQGTLAEISELRAPGSAADRAERPGDDSRAVGTSGTDRTDIAHGDLAKIEVSSVEQIAEACGSDPADRATGAPASR